MQTDDRPRHLIAITAEHNIAIDNGNGSVMGYRGLITRTTDTRAVVGIQIKGGQHLWQYNFNINVGLRGQVTVTNNVTESIRAGVITVGCVSDSTVRVKRNGTVLCRADLYNRQGIAINIVIVG